MGLVAYGTHKYTNFSTALNVSYGPPDVSIKPPLRYVWATCFLVSYSKPIYSAHVDSINLKYLCR